MECERERERERKREREKERELQWRSQRSKRDIPDVFPVVLRGGSTRLKITWVQQRQHHRAHESARERMLSRRLNTIGNHMGATEAVP